MASLGVDRERLPTGKKRQHEPPGHAETTSKFGSVVKQC